jgi:hypothetical protein
VSEEHSELPPYFMLVSSLAYPSTLKIETICSSENSIDFRRNTHRYISEDGTFKITAMRTVRMMAEGYKLGLCIFSSCTLFISESLQQSPSYEAFRSSANSAHFAWNPQVHYRVYKSPMFVLVSSQVTAARTLKPY